MVPSERLLYRIGPAAAANAPSWEDAVASALSRPIACAPLEELARERSRVVVLVDDVTRPTPQGRLLPPLLQALGAAGVPDENITLLVALGTHRYMTQAEMRDRFGADVCRRVRVLNHEWRDPATFADLGRTERGLPVRVNRIASEADLLMGVGSIAPHIWAGWTGGGKIVLPGICSAEVIGPAHALAEEEGDLMRVSGTVEGACRHEIESVARRVGLRCVLNVVLDGGGACLWAGFGEPVRAHRAGAAAARKALVRPIPALADVVIVDASPATKDYWQGIKALAHGERGVKAGGTVILVGRFEEGIAPSHPEFQVHARAPYDSIPAAVDAGRIRDRVMVTTLRLHALLRDRCHVVCLSDGVKPEEKECLGFRHAGTAAEALEIACESQGPAARFGVIDFGASVLPQVRAS